MPVVETGEPAEIGFPLLVKAAAGGGGRGMRVVRSAVGARAGARGRAARGGGGLRRRHGLLRALPRATPATSRCSCSPTTHGTVLALGERECSIQRRHQKVLEESPSPAHRRRAPAAALRRGGALRARDRLPRRGHGRVRRLGRRVLLPRAERADPGRASGDRARHRAATSSPTRSGSRSASRSRARATRLCGHAIEVRLYAEDPRTFLPQAGRIDRLRLPGLGPRRRRRRRRATRSARATTR